MKNPDGRQGWHDVTRYVACLASMSLMLTGCASLGSQDPLIASNSTPTRVVTQIINNSCGDEDEAGSESNSTGKVKGLSKVKDGFGIPYDEYAKEYVCPPVPVTDDSYETNKNRGIGYAGIEDHYADALAAGQTHSPDHPEHENVGSFFALTGLSTEEEKYGCCMRWEYAGWQGGAVTGEISVDGYLGFLNGNGSGHKQYLAIHALKTDKWCICCPYDYGPATSLPVSGSEHYGRIGGVSPQTAEDLGLGGGDCPDANLTEWWWVDNSEQVKCGPVSDLSQLTKGASSASAASTGTTPSTAKVVTRVAAEVVGSVTGQAVADDSSPVAIEPASANSFIDMTDASWCHGDLPRSSIRYIVLQDTNSGTEDATSTLDRWRAVGFQSVPHFIVGRDGMITQCVPIDRIAHHSGTAPAGANAAFGIAPERDDSPDGTGDSAMDAWSVGIALVHEGYEDEYPAAQTNALDRLVAYIREQATSSESPTLISKGEWLNGRRSSLYESGDAGPMTEDDAATEDVPALQASTTVTPKDDAAARESAVPQSAVDGMGKSVTGTFPMQEYASSGNHTGTTTAGEARAAKESGACSDDDGDEGNPNAGGPGIAKKAVDLSGSASPSPQITGGWGEVPSDARLQEYVSEKNRVYPGVPGWADCGRFAATAVKSSGADDSFPGNMDTAYQYEYMTQSIKWDRIGTLRAGDSPDELCKPGDVLVTEGKGHIMIYVGNEAVKKKYPDSNANMAEASLGAYYGWCYSNPTHMGGFSTYAIFRCAKPDNATAGEGDGSLGGTREAIVSYCRRAIGCAYDYTPSGGVEGSSYNCSFLSTCAYKAAGLSIPSWQGHQNGDGSQSDAVRAAGNWTTDPSKLKPGDLVFFGSDPYNTGHVGISLGGDQMIDSSYDGVAQRTLSGSFVGGGWPFPGDGNDGAGTSQSDSGKSSKKSSKSTGGSSLTTSGAVKRSSPWVKTDSAYLKTMIKKAEKYGSDTGWFCCVDTSINTSYGPRATILHKVGKKWRVELGTDCICGIRAQDAEERGMSWDNPRSRSFKGVWAIQYQNAVITACNRYTSCYVVCHDPGSYPDLPHNHDCQCFETQGYGDPRELPKERRFRSAGCCGLREEDAKYIYQHCPLGTPVCVFDEAEPEPADKRGDVTIDPSNSDNGGVLQGDSSAGSGGDGRSINVEVNKA